ncbi:hypothetical protein HY415_00220 [Candidatus Kaiserbacteria bacterium]|nr:hypothetical protein [Candidatus Kaiserbacteria bacterium]
MSDVGSDAQASMELAQDAALELRRKNPNHPLLKYWFLAPEDMGPDGEPKNPTKEAAIKTELKNRFWRRAQPWRKASGALVVAVVYSNYWMALRRAIRRKEGRPRT